MRRSSHPKRLRMALVNIKCVYSDLPDRQAKGQALVANIQRHLYFIDRAAQRGAEFVGFPEISLNGYRFSSDMAWLSLSGEEVGAISQCARANSIYISVGLAEQDAHGKRWNTQIVVGPEGEIIGQQRKRWLTKEAGFVESAQDRETFEVKGLKMGIVICADGSDYHNLKALADQGAQIIYGAHANSTGSTLAGWYSFRAAWAGRWDGQYMTQKNHAGIESEVPTSGWINQLGVHAALHNHAGWYSPEFGSAPGEDFPTRWASGAWFIGPHGQTLAQMPTSHDPKDSKEYLLICDIPAG